MEVAPVGKINISYEYVIGNVLSILALVIVVFFSCGYRHGVPHTMRGYDGGLSQNRLIKTISHLLRSAGCRILFTAAPLLILMVYLKL